MDPRSLIERLARQEDELRETHFLAPCLRGGRVRVRLEGLVHELTPRQADFEGWGLFQAVDEGAARLVGPASAAQVEKYLSLLRPLRVLLSWRLERGSWLAYPAHEGDAAQRFGAELSTPRPVVVHLVDDAGSFDQVRARFDGASFWFESVDRGADPRLAERLREALREVEDPVELRWKGLTPEMRTAYRLALDRELAREMEGASEGPGGARRDEARLRRALRFAGGALGNFHDRGDFWSVEWTTRDGVRHTSAIAKRDLTVLSAGLCLDGRDRDFDLQSLVGVVEGADF